MREGAFSKLDLQPWRHVLVAGSQSQASTCCCAADVPMMSLRYAGPVVALGGTPTRGQHSITSYITCR